MSEQGRIFSRNNGSSVGSSYELFFQFLGHFFKNFQQNVVEQDFQEFVTCEIVLKRESVNSPSSTLYLFWVGKLSKLNTLPSHSVEKWKKLSKIEKKISQKCYKLRFFFTFLVPPLNEGTPNWPKITERSAEQGMFSLSLLISIMEIHHLRKIYNYYLQWYFWWVIYQPIQ